MVIEQLLEKIKTLQKQVEGLEDEQQVLSETIDNLHSDNELLVLTAKSRCDLFSSSIVGLWKTRLSDGTFLDANQTTAKLVGYNSPEDIIGKHRADDFYPHEDRLELLAQLKKFGEVHDHEVHIDRDNGVNGYISISAKAYKEENVLEGVIVDITERKLAEQALRESEQRLRLLIDSAEDLIIMQDRVGKCIYFNGLSLLGIKSEDMIGRKPYSLFDMDTADRMMHRFNLVYATGQTVHSESEITCKGKTIWFDETVTSVRDASENIIGVTTISRNISRRKKNEKEIEKAQRLESLGLLANGIAHDFNNLLSGLFGNIDMALELSKDDEGSEYLRNAMKVFSQAKELTTQLLTFSDDKVSFKKQVQIKTLLKTVEKQMLGKSIINCKYDFDEKLPLVDVDEGQLQQVFGNIMLNCYQSMSNGGTIIFTGTNLTIHKNQMLDLTDGDYVYITVTYQSSEVALKQFPSVIDPFLTTKKVGEGLSFTASYSIVKQHGGHIIVNSEMGSTTVAVWLPVAEKYEGTEIVHDETGDRYFSADVLLMDDDQIILDMAGAMLEFFGCNVTIAENGEEAVSLYNDSIVENKKYDIVILDLTVRNGMGGEETLLKLKDIDPNVKCVVSSGYSNKSILINPSEFGFVGAIAKPYRKNDLSDLLYSVLKKEEVGSDLNFL